MSSWVFDKYCQLDRESIDIMKMAYDKYSYSARAYNKFLKIARTFADLDGSSHIRREDIMNVLLARDLDKEETRMYTV